MELSPIFGKATMALLMHTCIDPIAILGHVNSTIEQNRQGHIVGCLDSQFRKLIKKVPANSERLFGDDITKSVMAVQLTKVVK